MKKECICITCDKVIPDDEAAIWLSYGRWSHIGCYVRKAAVAYQHLDIATRVWGTKETLE